MDTRTARHLISNLRRHYNLQGVDILACYDTAVVALRDRVNDIARTQLSYVTVSVSPANFKRLKTMLTPEDIFKHPGSNVECLKLFGRLYVRSEVRVSDENVQWSSSMGCYTLTPDYLIDVMQRVTIAARSSKKQVTHANEILNLLSKQFKRYAV